MARDVRDVRRERGLALSFEGALAPGNRPIERCPLASGDATLRGRPCWWRTPGRATVVPATIAS